MKKVIYEATDPQKLLDTDTGVWEVSLRKGTAKWLEEKNDYELGDVMKFTSRRYVDAERAGFSGYVSREVELPACIVLEAAEALQKGELPQRGRWGEDDEGDDIEEEDDGLS